MIVAMMTLYAAFSGPEVCAARQVDLHILQDAAMLLSLRLPARLSDLVVLGTWNILNLAVVLTQRISQTNL